MEGKLAAIHDYESYSKTRMSKSLFQHLTGFTSDGVTAKENNEDFEKIKLRLRGMMNVKFFENFDVTVLGHRFS